ncbi:hypothetical protein MIDIC_230095 [Alphaproteobacteria bacterium]
MMIKVSIVRSMCRGVIMLLIITIFSDVHLVSAGYDAKGAVEKLLLQMGAVIKTRNYQIISNFFNFYVSADAKFFKKSVLYIPDDSDDSDNQEKAMAQEELTMGRKQYVDYFYNIIKKPECYDYVITIDSITSQNDAAWESGTIIIASFHVAETAITKIAKKQIYGTTDDNSQQEEGSQVDTINVKTLVSTNCNVSIMFGSSPVITGSSCFEKISIQ